MANDQGLGFTLSRRAQLNPDNTALIFREEQWTYADLNQLTNKVAHGLHALGVNPGDRVGFLGLNHPRFFFTLFAAAKLGAIFVPLNFRLTGPELTFIIRDAGLHTLVYEEGFASIVDSIRADLSVREYVCAVEQSGSRGFDSLLHDQRDSDLDYPVAMSDVALIMYTSGTTGRPRGAMLTHGNIIWNNINATLADDGTSQEISLVVAPLFHIGGLNVTPLLSFMKGATVVMEQMFEPGMVLENIERFHVTSMFGVPAMYLFMAQHPDFATRNLSSIRVLSCGGAPVPEALIKIYAARGLPFNQGYGLTETAPFASFLPSSMATRKLGSAGIAPFFTDVKVVDDAGHDVPDGERGEIVDRGPNVMKGYRNRPDATAPPPLHPAREHGTAAFGCSSSIPARCARPGWDGSSRPSGSGSPGPLAPASIIQCQSRAVSGPAPAGRATAAVGRRSASAACPDAAWRPAPLPRRPWPAPASVPPKPATPARPWPPWRL